MAIRPILKYPDPGLRRPAAAVAAFDDDLRALASDLVDTMRAAPGVGITAPHVGVSLRLTAIELDRAAGPLFYVNPRVLEASAETGRHTEGSVSMPGITDEVERPIRVRVAWQDLDGVAHEDTAEGFLAVCLQHEIDQLDGVFWIERLSRLKRDRLVKRWSKWNKAAAS